MLYGEDIEKVIGITGKKIFIIHPYDFVIENSYEVGSNKYIQYYKNYLFIITEPAYDIYLLDIINAVKVKVY